MPVRPHALLGVCRRTAAPDPAAHEGARARAAPRRGPSGASGRAPREGAGCRRRLSAQPRCPCPLPTGQSGRRPGASGPGRAAAGWGCPDRVPGARTAGMGAPPASGSFTASAGTTAPPGGRGCRPGAGLSRRAGGLVLQPRPAGRPPALGLRSGAGGSPPACQLPEPGLRAPGHTDGRPCQCPSAPSLLPGLPASGEPVVPLEPPRDCSFRRGLCPYKPGVILQTFADTGWVENPASPRRAPGWLAPWLVTP